MEHQAGGGRTKESCPLQVCHLCSGIISTESSLSLLVLFVFGLLVCCLLQNSGGALVEAGPAPFLCMVCLGPQSFAG